MLMLLGSSANLPEEELKHSCMYVYASIWCGGKNVKTEETGENVGGDSGLKNKPLG